jgi:hypothetical protein
MRPRLAGRRVCAIGYAGWQGDKLKTVGEVETCWIAHTRLGEAGACRHFLNTYDEWDHDTMRKYVWAEVE